MAHSPVAFALQDIHARILGDSITERNCAMPLCIGMRNRLIFDELCILTFAFL